MRVRVSVCVHVSACLREVKRATPSRDAKANENAEDLPMREWPPPPKPRTAGKESEGRGGILSLIA